jgi:hypothetical protein
VSCARSFSREELGGRREVFHNGRLTMVEPDGKRHDIGRIKICYPLGQPQAYDEVSVSEGSTEEIVPGIYELKGDVLRESFTFPADWKRPRSFGEAPLFFEKWLILKRVK